MEAAYAVVGYRTRTVRDEGSEITICTRRDHDDARNMSMAAFEFAAGGMYTLALARGGSAGASPFDFGAFLAFEVGCGYGIGLSIWVRVGVRAHDW